MISPQSFHRFAPFEHKHRLPSVSPWLRRATLAAGLAALCVLAFSGMLGCKGGANTNNPASSKIKVVASFYPMADFAQKIGGERVEVTNLVPSGTEPHDWEPSTNDVKTIANAQLLVYSGAGMESWVDSVKDSLNGGPQSVMASEGVALRHGYTEDDEADNTSTDTSGGIDPHVWLDPENAKIEMRNIAHALEELDAANKDYYEQNFTTYAQKLDDLNNAFSQGLAPLPHHTIVVSHEAFGYLCDAYGLTQLGIEGLSADSEPDAQRMAQIVDFVKKNDVKTIFFEDLVSPKVAQTIADETGAQAKQLNPVEGLTDKQLNDGEDYFSVMTENLQTLQEALA